MFLITKDFFLTKQALLVLKETRQVGLYCLFENNRRLKASLYNGSLSFQVTHIRFSLHL